MGIQPKRLDPDPDSMNPDSKHWKNLKFPIEDMFQILYVVVGCVAYLMPPLLEPFKASSMKRFLNE
jgi:hypothetical protein